MWQDKNTDKVGMLWVNAHLLIWLYKLDSTTASYDTTPERLSPLHICVTDQACSVKLAGYWENSFFHVDLHEAEAIKNEKKRWPCSQLSWPIKLGRILWIARAVTSAVTIILKHFKKLKLEIFHSMKYMQGKILYQPPTLLFSINVGLETGI